MPRSPSIAVPLSGSCSVARVRIRVDLPAPLGPRSPYIPAGMVSETSSSALTPFGYVLERCSTRRTAFAVAIDSSRYRGDRSSVALEDDCVNFMLCKVNLILAHDSHNTQ